MFLKTCRITYNKKGIISHRTYPYTLQQNGVSKRKNRHLLDTVRPLLLQSFVPSRFWLEALSIVVHLINPLPSPCIANQMHYFCLFNQQPGYSHLHTFGCVCFIFLPPSKCTKLTAQPSRCAFLGYATNQKGLL